MSSDHPLGQGGVLLTGATGFLGMEVLARYLEHTPRTVFALVRAGTDAEAERRLRAMLDSALGDRHAHADRVVAVRGDLLQPRLGLTDARRDELAERVTEVVHCAASVSFVLSLAAARAINVDGARRVLELASLCDRRSGLRCFTHVSTAYVAGARRGIFGEGDQAPEGGFRNSYEHSKAEAERLALDSGLPVQILRPSIVVGDSRSGWTPTFNVVYSPLRAFARGAYSVLPGRRSAPVDVVPVDYVADGIVSLGGRPGTVYHLTAGGRAPTLGEFRELACSYFERPRPRLLPPVLYRRLAHPLLVRRTRGSVRRALERSEAYFPYFDARVHYDNSNAQRALKPLGVEVPGLPEYFGRLMDFACRTDWGRQPVSRADALAGSGPEPAPAIALA